MGRTRITARVGAVAIAAAMALAACGSSGGSGGGSTPSGSSSSSSGGSASSSNLKPGLAFDVGGKGDKSFNDSADAGLTKAAKDFGFEGKFKELSPNKDGSDRQANLQLLAQTGYNPVFAIGFSYADAVTAVAKQFPNTSFVIIDSVVAAPNVRSLTFAANESSYLVGAAAALATKTNQIGYVEAQKIDLLENFRAGYEAGARKIKPNIKIDFGNLNDETFSDTAKAKEQALSQYQKGADVVYQVAGGAGIGVFQAAAQVHKLAIGVDSDQYTNVGNAAEAATILTSALKRVDTGVYDSIQEFKTSGKLSGTKVFDLKVNGVGYSTANPIFKPYAAQIAALAAQIKSGAIQVPTKPSD